MKPIHLEGMGVNGALLAHTLARYGVAFTWHDTDIPFVAWKASTGAIYPAGAENHGPDKHCYDVWKSWYDNGYFSQSHLERSTAFIFCTKNPPHKGDYAYTMWAGTLNAGPPSYHLNAQEFVAFTRQRFEHTRIANDVAELAKRSKGLIYIVTHGWGERFHHAYWGWARFVQLEINEDSAARPGNRPSFYFRPDRFSMAYAYPVPGTDLYYAGSSIIKQKAGKLRQLEIEPKYDRWKRIFEREGQGHVKVAYEGAFASGWRPAAADEDEAWVKYRKGGDGRTTLTLRPLWNSGIRHFPKQWAQVAAVLGLVA